MVRIWLTSEMVSFLELILGVKTMPTVLLCGLCLRVIQPVFKLEMELAIVTVLLVEACACNGNSG